MLNNNCDYCIGTNNAAFKQFISTVLNQAGYYSAGNAKNIPSLLRLLRSVQPWLVVVDTELPPGNISELADIIENDALAAAIYINTGTTKIDGYVSLDYPVKQQVLIAVANAVCSEYARKKRMHSKIASLQQKIDEQKIIDRAKRLLIKKYSLSEEEAFRLIQKNSMDCRISMAETATRVISNPGTFASLLPPR
jgi:response regulator NasT